MEPIQNNKLINSVKTSKTENKKTNNFVTHYLNTTEKKIAAGVGVFTILTIIVTKGKSIIKTIKKGLKSLKEWIKNSSKKVKKETAEIKPEIKPEIPPVKKFELPEPKFTCGEENPRQLAKEKAEYIKSIWDETVTVKNKERNIAGLEAIGKYGTIDDIGRLDVSYRRGHNEEERIAFAKAVAAVGKGGDSFWSMAILEYAEKDETKIEILKSIVKTLEKEKGIFYKNDGYQDIVESFQGNSNKQISDLAKQALSLITIK